MRSWYLTKKKPFHNEVDFAAVEKYKWIWLMLCAQLKHGGPKVCKRIIDELGGTEDFGQDLFEAVDEMLPGEGSWARSSGGSEQLPSKQQVTGSSPVGLTNIEDDGPACPAIELEDYL